MLVEGVTAGQGQMVVTFKNGSATVAQDALDVSFQEVTNLWEDWSIQGTDPTSPLYHLGYDTSGIGNLDANGGVLPSTVAPTSDSGSPLPLNRNTKNYILLVPGWNLTPLERRNFAASAFKRLYWQGFRGQFGLFNWPTNAGFGVGKAFTDPRNFDNSEYIAFASAPALLTLLTQLKSAGYSVNVLAHSMGNIVVSEALREGAAAHMSQLVNTYIATQAAVPSSAYDSFKAGTFAQQYPLLTAAGGNTPDLWLNSPLATGPINSPYFGSIHSVTGEMYNFYNVQDYALTQSFTWPGDQISKPDSSSIQRYSYAYTPTLGGGGFYTEYTPNGSIVLNPANQKSLWHILSYITAMNTYAPLQIGNPGATGSTALGATPHVGGPFNSLGEVDLQDNNIPKPSRLNDQHYDHNGEFYHDNPTEQFYWNLVMKRFGLLVPVAWPNLTAGLDPYGEMRPTV
ncbi:MAG: alpha/beta hydrolase [Planctomycetota bacterium]|nr:alpha/beta hydrolase [Planctomycetota bacterium]